MSFAKVIVVGNLGRDPELKYTPQGQAVCTFSVAAEVRKSKTEKSTNWYRITAWGANAENCGKYLTKGKQVYVDGELSVQEFTNKLGEKQFSLEVNAKEVKFLSAAGGQSQAASAGGTSFLSGNQNAVGNDAIDDSDIAF